MSLRLNDWLKNASNYKVGVTFEELIEKTGLEKHKIIRLAGNENTFGASPKAILAAQNSLDSSNFYDEPYSDSLNTDIKRYFWKNTQFHEKILNSKLEVVSGNGMDSIIELCLKLFCNPNDSILNMNPSFSFYEFAAKRAGINIIQVPRKLSHKTLEEVYSIDSQEIIKQITTKKPKIVFLCSPNNPTAELCSLKDIGLITSACAEVNSILFIDHAYIQFCKRNDNEAIDLCLQNHNIILGYTFSKAYGLAGYRVGFGLMQEPLARIFKKYQTPFLISKPSIAAAKAALKDIEHVNRTIINNNTEKQKYYNFFESIKIPYTKSDANFILIKTTQPSSIILDKMLSRGIILRAMSSVSPNHLRISIGKAHENDSVISTFQQIL